ncbi:MAG: hypothetical protein HC908_06530 [Calothrix sp. SM1_7_51]|nr:hypothetical protein [Calothrix sp. SM1_7_51]
MNIRHVGVGILVAASFMSASVRADDDFAVPLSQVNRCLSVATAAQPGNIKEVDMEKDDNRRVCGVKIYHKNREYKVKVDLSNYRVLKVEKDD